MKSHFSPKELAQALGVSESSVKRWSDAGRIRMVRTVGGHRRIPAAEAANFIRRNRYPLARTESLGVVERVAGSEENESDTLYACLRGGNEAEALDLVQLLYMRGWSVDRIVDGPFRTAMSRLGELWAREGDVAILWEHRATRIGLSVLHGLRALLPEPDGSGGRAVGGAVGDDPYLLPTMAVSMSLQDAGYRAHDLGPMTPTASLCQAIEQWSPQLVWISSTADQSIEESLETVARAARAHGAHVVLGGRTAPDRQLPDGVSAMATLAALTGFARSLVKA